MSSFAEALSALMDEQGISGNALARKVYCNRSLISRYRSGKQQPSARLAQLCDEALGAEGELVALSEKRPSRRAVLTGGLLAGGVLAIAPDTLERLAWAQRHPPQIDAAVVESLADVLAAQRRADDALGSAAVLRPILTQLTAIEDLVKQARGPVRPALVDVAQQWAQFTGWLCRDIGDTAGARACCALALEWATEVGDRTMAATILNNRSAMAGEAGEIGAMIGLAQGAQRDTTAAAAQRADAANLEAQGFAMAGDASTAERKLGEAQDLACTLTDRPQDQRPWSYWMTPAVIQSAEGHISAYLAGTGPRWYERAVDLLATRPETSGTPLWKSARNLTWLAFAHARAGDVDNACAAGLQATRVVQRAGSARNAATLSQIRADLQARYPADPRVKQLADALTQ